jgi:hypothetical protein
MEGAKYAALASVALTMVACNGPSHPAAKVSNFDRCLHEANQYNLAVDICEGLNKSQAVWDNINIINGWTKQTPQQIKVEFFGLPKPDKDCWAYNSDTTIVVCWNGEVTTS